MPIRGGSAAPSSGGGPAGGPQTLEERNKWVTVSWMPHASLSQTSHVCLSVRSILSSLDELKHFRPEEWQVRVTAFGVAGLPLVPVHSLTPAAPVESAKTANSSNSNSSNNSSNTTTNNSEQKVSDSSTRIPSVSNITHICRLDSLLHIPIRWRDLPRDSYLKFEVLGHCDETIYEAHLPMFNAYGKLHTGLMRLKLGQPGGTGKNRNIGLSSPTKRSVTSPWQQDDDDPVWKASRMLDQLQRFEQAKGRGSTPAGTNKAFGDIPSVPWLDSMAKRYCETTLREAETKAKQHAIYGEGDFIAFLIVELPVFDVPVMHEETFYPTPQHGPSGSLTPLDLALYKQKQPNADTKTFHPFDAIPFLDYENENDNPVEDKYRTLAHDLLRGLVDPALKPDREQRDRLAAIIASPSHHPSRAEKDLLWKFRFSLVDNRRALTKFLLAVDWTVESEVVQAAELLEQWRKRSPIEVTDALKLLGKQVAYQTNLVRAYAIDTLASAPDEELSLYLLQLVQALKFENIQETGVNHGNAASSAASSLSAFLIERATKNIMLANYLYWYLKVELQDPTHGARYREVFAELQRSLSLTPFVIPTRPDPKPSNEVVPPSVSISEVGKEALSTPFKTIVSSVSKIGSTLRGADVLPAAPEPARNLTKSVWDVLSAQDMFISGIMDAQMSCGTKGKKDAKEAHLRSVLAKEGYDKSPRRDSFPLPCAPEVMVNGVKPETAKIFKSAVYPALVEFYVDSVYDKEDFGQANARKRGSLPFGAVTPVRSQLKSYKVIVKTGDDLRQDQLVMMMIKLMDGLLKRASLDLWMTPYSIIATSPTSGIIEFVDGSSPVSRILADNNNSILQFFQTNAPLKGAKYDIRPEVLSTFVRSCAGYCVLTYLLGVGDRHLDNILITEGGHFFHIDFGFMFGRDPKPLPPAFRLTREMVEGMGGLDSTEYRQFCSLACQAFNALRKSAGLVLNLLHLMSDAGIEDLSNNPSADAEGVIAKVEERFRLELTDEQAERFFLNLIGDCLTAIAPRVMDVFHSIAVARR